MSEQMNPMEFPEIAAELSVMAARDQEMRNNTMENGEAWNPAIDQENTARMKEIIKQIGWPTISKVGAKASGQAWLLAQHADHDRPFQKECLELMQAAAEDVDPQNMAYIEDRIRVAEKKLQRYGTQFHPKNFEPGDEMVPYPIEDAENVDMRRDALGMEPLAEKTKRMNSISKK